uniref:Uncharacterized protein n=1 Tax=Phaeomonas parva TaxID=124430 RepID=A0A7S1TUE0_9STRA
MTPIGKLRERLQRSAQKLSGAAAVPPGAAPRALNFGDAAGGLGAANPEPVPAYASSPAVARSSGVVMPPPPPSSATKRARSGAALDAERAGMPLIQEAKVLLELGMAAGARAALEAAAAAPETAFVTELALFWICRARAEEACGADAEGVRRLFDEAEAALSLGVDPGRAKRQLAILSAAADEFDEAREIDAMHALDQMLKEMPPPSSTKKPRPPMPAIAEPAAAAAVSCSPVAVNLAKRMESVGVASPPQARAPAPTSSLREPTPPRSTGKPMLLGTPSSIKGKAVRVVPQRGISTPTSLRGNPRRVSLAEAQEAEESEESDAAPSAMPVPSPAVVDKENSAPPAPAPAVVGKLVAVRNPVATKGGASPAALGSIVLDVNGTPSRRSRRLQKA